MKKLCLIALLAASSFAQIQKIKFNETYFYPPGFTTPQNAPEIPFDTPNPDYFVLPEGMQFGEIGSVTSNAKGHVWILSRGNHKGNTYGGSATQVFEFDQNGKYVREIGRDSYGFAYGHGIRTDKDDNIWVVDKGTNMATKWSNRTGKVMMVLGRRPELTSKYWQQAGGRGAAPGAAAPAERPGYINGAEDGGFDEPTDIGFDSQGNMYVSDGYGHSRVAKFDKDGGWIGSFGHAGPMGNNIPGPSEFSTVHNISVDKYDHVWVADRSNGRAQVFDSDGKYMREVILNVPVGKPGGYQPLMGHQGPPGPDNKRGGELRPGTPDALCIPVDNPNVIYFGDVYPGRIYKVNITDGKVIGWFGHVGRKPGELGAIHGMGCAAENIIYSAEFVSWKSQKFVLHPEKMQTQAGKPATSAAR